MYYLEFKLKSTCRLGPTSRLGLIDRLGLTRRPGYSLLVNIVQLNKGSYV